MRLMYYEFHEKLHQSKKINLFVGVFMPWDLIILPRKIVFLDSDLDASAQSLFFVEWKMIVWLTHTYWLIFMYKMKWFCGKMCSKMLEVSIVLVNAVQFSNAIILILYSNHQCDTTYKVTPMVFQMFIQDYIREVTRPTVS